jgi:hypothetical protein
MLFWELGTMARHHNNIQITIHNHKILLNIVEFQIFWVKLIKVEIIESENYNHWDNFLYKTAFDRQQVD